MRYEIIHKSFLKCGEAFCSHMLSVAHEVLNVNIVVK